MLVSGGGSEDKSVKVWSIAVNAHNTVTAQLKETLPPVHTDGITCVSFSPDGTRIASGSKDRTVCIYEMVGNNYAGSNVTVLKKHCGGITSLAFSPDSSNLVSTDDKADEVDMDLMNTSKYADLFLETIPQLFIQFSNTLLTNTVSTAFIISMIWTVGNAFWNLYHLCYYVFVIGEKITDWKTFMRKVRNIPQPTSDLNNFSYRYDVANETAMFNAWMSKVKGYFTWLCCPSIVADERADQRIQRYEMVRQQSTERHVIEENNFKDRISELEANVDVISNQRDRLIEQKAELIASSQQLIAQQKALNAQQKALKLEKLALEATVNDIVLQHELDKQDQEKRIRDLELIVANRV